MTPKRTKKIPGAPKKMRVKRPVRKARTDDGDTVELVKTAEAKKTGFLSLAAELRNEIYLLALTRPQDITIPDRKESMSKTGADLPPVVCHEPAMLATCHEIRNEALPVFYGTNTFAMKYAIYGVKLVEQLGPKRTAMLKALKPCGTEQVKYVTADRWSHVTVCQVNRMLDAASALSTDAVLMPVGYGASGGWEKLSESKEHKVERENGKAVVKWTGRQLEPAFSVYEW